ncbi:MAG TPA: HdeD family acid-resistance protein [Candidatus Eremiobacteraceae bacterium]|nr:HdeD family acid-resistance protein [Candidatus Eremiobacteraceae bacterium]
MLQTITGYWWLFLLRGLAAIVVGVIAFIQPGATLMALVIVLGAYSFVVGVLALTAGATGVGGDRWWALLLEGILGIVVAFLIWFWPVTSTMAFVYFVAAWFIVMGIVQIAGGIRLRDIIDNEWLYILGGIISIAFGVWVFRTPVQGTEATGYLFGFYFLLYGIVQVVLAFKLRSLVGSVQKAVKSATSST